MGWFKCKKKGNKPAEGEKTSSTNKLTEEQVWLFKKYALFYSLQPENPQKGKDLDIDKVRRQKYVYKCLKQKGLEQTGIEKLLDITIAETDKQYQRKERFENRAGFLLAFWGITIGLVIQEGILDGVVNAISQSKGSAYMDVIIMLVVLLVLTMLSLLMICKCIFPTTYMRFDFQDRECNYGVAADDRELTYIYLLEAYTNVWEYNEKLNRKRAGYLQAAIICTALNTIVVLAILLSIRLRWSGL